MKFLKLLAVVSFCGLVSCSFPGVYKIPIQQGNTLDPDKLAQLEIGQTMHQVKFLLGTPLIADPLSPGRWDYAFSLKQGDKIYKEEHLVVIFDNQGKLQSFDKTLSEVYQGGKTREDINEEKANKTTAEK